jgi:hypothetical protein
MRARRGRASASASACDARFKRRHSSTLGAPHAQNHRHRARASHRVASRQLARARIATRAMHRVVAARRALAAAAAATSMASRTSSVPLATRIIIAPAAAAATTALAREGATRRAFSSSSFSSSAASTKSRVDALNDMFVEAREEIESAQESVGSTYFNDDYDIAKACVDDVVRAWEELLASMSDEDDKAAMRRSMGLKIEQLKGEFALLDHAHDDHD